MLTSNAFETVFPAPPCPKSALISKESASSADGDASGVPNQASNSCRQMSSSSDKKLLQGGSEYDARPSNERLLGTAFITFMSFAILELCFAYIADSQAMKGDAAAMMVDSMTYFFNWRAEHCKNHFSWDRGDNILDPVQALFMKQMAYRKMVLKMEIIPPLISVITLLGVTVVISHQALKVLLGQVVPISDESPNLGLMLCFSTLNLSLDILNVCYFSKAKDILVQSAIQTPSALQSRQEFQQDELTGSLTSSSQNNVKAGGMTTTTDTGADYKYTDSELVNTSSILVDTCLDCEDKTCSDAEHGGNINDRTNLNMCSAFTHVFADTLRSLAVIIAATFAEICPSVTPEEADATAALAVSILILLSLIPLLRGLVGCVIELNQIYAEEKVKCSTWQRQQQSLSSYMA